MEFTVPQFIEKESKIVGPFTFKQFIFIGIGGAIAVFLYLATPFFIFLLGGTAAVGGAFALAFLKVERTALPSYISNMFSFMFKPKLYLWDKKTGSPKFFIKEKEVVEELVQKPEDKKPDLRVSSSSRLGSLLTKLETK